MTPQEIVAELDRIRERIHANALHSAGGVHDLLDALIARLGEKNAKPQRKAGKGDVGDRPRVAAEGEGSGDTGESS